MRDVVRDAAIVTMAEARRVAGTPAEAFLELYEDEDSTLPEYVTDLLYDLRIIKQEWQEFSLWDDRYDDLRGENVWVWNEDIL